MSFADSLNAVHQPKSQELNGKYFCVYGAIYSDNNDIRLTKDDKDHIKQIEETIDATGVVTVSSANMRLALRNENIEISDTAIQRHRRKVCKCYSIR